MLKARGIGVIFEEQNINTLKTDSELYLVIYAGFAQSESESMSKNITWAFRKNFENGKAGFVYKKFLGYRKGDDGQPVIVPEEAAVVREIYNMYLEGKTHLQISEIMQSRNYQFEGKDFQFNKSLPVNGRRKPKRASEVKGDARAVRFARTEASGFTAVHSKGTVKIKQDVRNRGRLTHLVFFTLVSSRILHFGCQTAENRPFLTKFGCQTAFRAFKTDAIIL